MFNEKSGLVQIWLRLLTQDNSMYSINDVPKISNLREIIQQLFKK